MDDAGADAPLAARMRPRTLDEVVGQEHLLGPGGPLRQLLEPGRGEPVSLVLWGPPGTGKTTLALLLAQAAGREFVQLSAINAGVKDVREVVERAKVRREVSGTGTVLFIDEVHRFSKTQQDALLPSVEHGWVTLVAATTENPAFSVIAPLLSRSLVLPLHPLTDAQVRACLDRAVTDDRGLAGRVALAEDAAGTIVRLAGGDARRSLTMLGAAASMVPDGGTVSAPDVASAVQRTTVLYDRAGDQHYDVISAFIKSIRGSDVDAGLHYLARMVEAGEDPRFIARRLVILASEDVGMADPSALQTAVAAMHAVAQIGLPEARITLAHAVVHLALAPKSNAVYLGIGAAEADVRAGRSGQVPIHLRDGNAGSARLHGHGVGYRYPHDDPVGILPQQYLPDALAGAEYYRPTDRGAEGRWRDIDARLRELRHGDDR